MSDEELVPRGTAASASANHEQPDLPRTPHTLWARDTLLGSVELTSLDPNGARTGPLRPSPAFTAVWPQFAAVQTAGASVMRSLLATPHRSDAAAIRTALQSAPDAPALDAAFAAVGALGVELRDAGGTPVPGVQVLVAEVTIPIPDDLPPDARSEVEAAMRAAGLERVNYLVVAVPNRTPSSGSQQPPPAQPGDERDA